MAHHSVLRPYTQVIYDRSLNFGIRKFWPKILSVKFAQYIGPKIVIDIDSCGPVVTKYRL